MTCEKVSQVNSLQYGYIAGGGIGHPRVVRLSMCKLLLFIVIDFDDCGVM